MTNEDDGRVLADRALMNSEPAALRPSGFDPSRWRDGDDLSAFKWPLSGYAPGDYMGRCHTCGDTVTEVDKRSMTCLCCAITGLRSAFEAIDGAFRIKVWNEAKKRGMSDRAAMEEVARQRAIAIDARSDATQCVPKGESAGLKGIAQGPEA